MEIRIREARQAAGFSQEKLAAAVGIDQSQISRIERGLVPVTLDRLLAIAEALRVSVYDLIEEQRP